MMRRDRKGWRVVVLAVSLLVPAVMVGASGSHHPNTPTAETVHTATVAVSVRYGSRGAAVSLVQARLVALGYHVKVDGWFGSQTRRAVMAYQRANRLYVDGWVGPRTWAKLSGTVYAVGLPPVPRTTYPDYHEERWHDLALANGWAEREWLWVACVMDHESDGDETAGGPNDGGLMQIWIPAHLDRGYTAYQMKHDPAVSLRLASIFFHEGQKGGPWKGATAECAGRGIPVP